MSKIMSFSKMSKFLNWVEFDRVILNKKALGVFFAHSLIFQSPTSRGMANKSLYHYGDWKGVQILRKWIYNIDFYILLLIES